MSATDVPDFLTHHNVQRQLFEAVVGATTPFLERVVVTVPGYTDHGPRHAERVAGILQDLLFRDDDDIRQYLATRPWTSFFLASASYLHDIGLVDFPDFRPTGGQAERTAAIRAQHHLRAAEILRKKWREFGLGNEHQARILGLIVEKHSGPLESADLVLVTGYLNESINVGFCRACIRLSDELDMSTARADQRLAGLLEDPVSQAHWEANYSISGVTRHPSLRQTIRVEGWCKSKEVHRQLRTLETKINKLLELVTLHVDPRLQYTRCIFEVLPEGFLDIDLKFTVDESSLWPIIIGDVLYKDRRVFIRELVQNAIDACSLRQYREPGYQPYIRLKHEGDRVVVTDNGVGMDLRAIEKYLVRICVCSYSQERLAGEKGLERFYPISQFGIGMLSCLLVSDFIQIKTGNGQGKMYCLDIHDVRDYIHIEETAEPYHGTEVSVKLRGPLSDVILFARETFKRTDIPVAYEYPSGDIEILGDRPFTKQEMLEFGRSEFADVVEYSIPFQSSQGLLWQFPGGSSAADGNFDILMNGIDVTRVSLLPKWCVLGGVAGVVNLRGEERLSITASRSDVARDAKFDALVWRVEAALITLLAANLKAIAGDAAAVREYFRSAIAAEKASPNLAPLVREYYHFAVPPTKGEKASAPRYLKYPLFIAEMRNMRQARLQRKLDTYDAQLIAKTRLAGGRRPGVST